MSLLSDYVTAANDTNATMQALRDYIEANGDKSSVSRTALDVFPFSSSVKYGAVTFSEGTYLLGAPEFVLRDRYGRFEHDIRPFAEKGYRVLVFASYDGDAKHGLSSPAEPLAYIILSNPIRKNAKETFGYFKEQGVQIKVISGDNPATVAEIAKQAGIDGAENFVDAATLDTSELLRDAAERYTVFGRVTPQQKKQLIQAFHRQKHTVAMTGDGVNDLLALKEADCSISVGQGSDAARQTAQLVLLDSDFAVLKDVLLEGRRVVHNVTRSAGVFFIKTLYSILLCVLCLLTNTPFPFVPIQITLIDLVIEGYPSFFLSFLPDSRPVRTKFLPEAIRRAAPNALAIGVCILFGIACNGYFWIVR